MTTKEIYEKYKIPPNLQTHMLRVAGVAKIITQNWKGEKIDEISIIEGCLVHDMGNIVRFNFDNTDMLDDPENIDYWRDVQKEFRDKYGWDEHHVTVSICEEMNLPQIVIDIAGDLDWLGIDNVLKDKNFNLVIATYSDMRVGPYGILSVEERIANIRARRKISTEYAGILEVAKMLESEIQAKTKIDLSLINNKAIEQVFDDLINLSIAD